MKCLCQVRIVLAAVLLGLLVQGCGDAPESGDGHSHAGHGHQPKNGGQLVEVGQHQFNLEVLAEPAPGRLTLWVLDAHAENYVRLTNASLPLTLVAAGETHPLTLRAVPNAASGETVGDTSQFEATDPWLTRHPEFAGQLDSLTLRGKSFTNLTFRHAAPGAA